VSLGLTFSDRESGIHITTVGVNDSPRYADVVVNFVPFQGTMIRSWRSRLAPSTSDGRDPDLTATASDEDGDTSRILGKTSETMRWCRVTRP